MIKCFFLDRDGVIIKDRRHVYKEKEIFITLGAQAALREIKNNKYLIIIITNQSVIGRGLISKKKFLEFNEKMNAKLSINLKKKVIDDIFFCPHHPSKAIGMYKLKCKCRKPGNKLIEDAIKKWKINRKKSVMIGDKFSDYLAAKRSKIKFYYKENSNFHDQVKKIINEKSY
jgi:UDP-N-acetylmuramoyl-tripeptide--D-alanyl-D-alanine ligase|tara:strand:+ start:1080 stop:1595 length:516 start_codon:yes stop_codon:yes gene_type:complete